jgi:hypothetical protein
MKAAGTTKTRGRYRSKRRGRKAQETGGGEDISPDGGGGKVLPKPPYTHLDACGVREGGIGKSCGETFSR